MQDSDLPTKIAVIWASAAGGGYVRPIPNTSQIGINNGWASYPDGFPPLNFQPVGSGGVPPFGQDMNGVLQQFSAWLQWMSAGGTTVYDSTFQGIIGGYPLGAIVESPASPGLYYQCISNNNVTDPDANGLGWAAFSFLGSNTRIITTVGNVATLVNDQALGYLRSGAGASSTTLPPLNSLSDGRVVTYSDLDGVTHGFGTDALTIFPNANQALAGGAGTFVAGTNLQTVSFRFYYGAGGGSNSIWGIER